MISFTNGTFRFLANGRCYLGRNQFTLLQSVIVTCTNIVHASKCSISTYQLTETFFFHRNVHCMYTIVISSIQFINTCYVLKIFLLNNLISIMLRLKNLLILVVQIFAAFILQNVA